MGAGEGLGVVVVVVAGASMSNKDRQSQLWRLVYSSTRVKAKLLLSLQMTRYVLIARQAC